MARRFVLIRDDHDTVNGPGAVAEGILFASGKVAINWTTRPQSVQMLDTMADLLTVQDRNGITRIKWLDADDQPAPRIETSGLARMQRMSSNLDAMLGSTRAVVTEEKHAVVMVLAH
jgi:hypothetical protein